MEIQSSQIYPNSLIFDETDSNQEFYCENDIYTDSQSNFQQNTSNQLQQLNQGKENNIYSNTETLLPNEKRGEKGRVLHLLKNFTQEMKVRWNMSDVEIRIHNFLDENQISITDPMQKQFDYYQKTKNSIMSSMAFHSYPCGDDVIMKETDHIKQESNMEIEDLGEAYTKCSSSKKSNDFLQRKGTLDFCDNEHDNNNNFISDAGEQIHQQRPQMQLQQQNRGKRLSLQSTMSYLDSFSTQNSLNSQLSLQCSSIFVKRTQSKSNSLILQAPRSLLQIDNDDTI